MCKSILLGLPVVLPRDKVAQHPRFSLGLAGAQTSSVRANRALPDDSALAECSLEYGGLKRAWRSGAAAWPQPIIWGGERGDGGFGPQLRDW